MNSRTDYGERFQAAMTHALVDVHDMAKALGVSYTAVKKVLTGGTKMLRADNNSVAARAMRVNADWLATGDGAMLDRKEPLSDRAIFIGAQLDAAEDADERERAMVLCENVAALARAGQLQAALSALQVLAPSSPAVRPTPQPRQHHPPQTDDGRAGPA